MGGGKVGKFLVKSQIILFVLLMVVNIALGVDSEFKNTLNKVEVTQSSDNSYNVKLYTQNSLPQGAKVIKKSDLSYYILLPETKNSASISSTSSKDIKQVSASTYPYAGSNNNGYTKINISTTKPVTFTVSTKSTSPVKVAETKKEEPVTLAKVSPETPQIVVQKPKSKITEVKVQQPKTKSVSEKEKIAVAPKTQTAPVQKTIKKQESKILPKIAVKNVKNNTKNKAAIPQKEVKKTTVTKQKTNVIAQKPKAVEKKPAAVKPVQNVQKPKVVEKKPIEKKAVEKPLAKPQIALAPVKKQENPQPKVNVPSEAEQQAKSLEDVAQENLQRIEENNQVEFNTKEETPQVADKISDKKDEIKNDIPKPNEQSVYYKDSNGLSGILFEYGITGFDLFLLAVVLILGLILAYLLFSKRFGNQARVRNKADLIDNTGTLHPKRSLIKDSEDAQSVVEPQSLTEIADESIVEKYSNVEETVPEEEIQEVQEEQEEPEVSEINTDAPTVLPDDVVTVTPILTEEDAKEEPQSVSSEEQIEIKEIVQEETSKEEYETEEIVSAVPTPRRNPRKPSMPSEIEIPDNVEPTPDSAKQTVQPQNVQPPVARVIDPNEPTVMSNIEIAPQRGFMCIAYQNNINLMGYILDDVFPLYDFKKPELDSYKIKFKMSERTKKDANFIVKVDDSKMIIKVTKNSMKLELPI